MQREHTVNWQTHLFLAESREALANAEAGGPPAKYTPEELDGLQRVLDEHERWLDEWVEKQKAVKMNEDPVILTSEMRARAKALENQLQKLVRKRPPPPKRKTTSTTSTTVTSSAEASETVSAESESHSSADEPPRHEEL